MIEDLINYLIVTLLYSRIDIQRKLDDAVGISV